MSYTLIVSMISFTSGSPFTPFLARVISVSRFLLKEKAHDNLCENKTLSQMIHLELIMLY
jgi:hypothetical protein